MTVGRAEAAQCGAGLGGTWEGDGGRLGWARPVPWGEQMEQNGITKP